MTLILVVSFYLKGNRRYNWLSSLRSSGRVVFSCNLEPYLKQAQYFLSMNKPSPSPLPRLGRGIG